jgi:HK97 family phage prohead protease
MTDLIRKQFTTEIESLSDRVRRFIVSTAAVDRDNDSISPKGWNLANYRKNPVVMFAHDYSSLPIAKAVSIRATGTQLISDCEFPPAGLHPFADQVLAMIDGGFLNATSVGFRPLKSSPNVTRGGTDYQEQELLEYSIVPVPANPEAIHALKAFGLWTPALEKAGRVLSGVNHEHLVAADTALTEATVRVRTVLAASHTDDDTGIEIDEDADDIDLEEVKAVMPGILKDMAHDIRQSVAAAVTRETARATGHGHPLELDRVHRDHFGGSGDEIDIDPATFAAALRDVLPVLARQVLAEAVRELPETINSAIRQSRGRLD